MRWSRFHSKNVITEGDNFWWEICQYVNIMFLSIYVIQQWNFNMQKPKPDRSFKDQLIQGVYSAHENK